jgi:hypothetical protein
MPTPTAERALAHQAPQESPDATPKLAQKAAGGLFGAISALRQSRSLHPKGVVFEATLTVERRNGHHPTEAPLFYAPGEKTAVVRLSKSVGLPAGVPDLLGLTVRFVDVHGPGKHQDFMLITSGDGAVAHHLMIPALSFFSLPYSSVLPYDIAGKTRLVGALQATPAPAPGRDFDQLLATPDKRFQLALAPLRSRWSPIGELALHDRIPQSQAEKIRFNPWNTGGGIRPTGPFMGLRAGAYSGSQAGWSA